MLHPILAKSRAIYAYLLVWIMFAVLQAVVVKQIINLDCYAVVIDSLIYNGVLLLLGLSFWFPLAYADKSKSQTLMAIHSFFAYVIYVGLWLIISYNLTNIILENIESYLIFTKRILPIRVVAGSVLLLLLGTLYHLFDFYQSLEEKKQQEGVLRNLVKEAELKALKAQLNPHFLFNSLNSISSLTITDVDSAREMINKLSDFLRYSLKDNDTRLLTLREELRSMAKYLEIEKVRFGDRLSCEIEMDDKCKDLLLPPMILQPLYENAVKHGVYESIEPVHIRTFCRCIDGYLEVSIINNYDSDSVSAKGEGVGLQNIQNRLKMIYHKDGLLTVTKENHHFEATLTIPQNQTNGKDI